MTQLIVARGESPGGGGDDPWTEGPNLLTNGAFEATKAPWDIYWNNETVERVTVGALTGAGSLHVVTTGNDDFEGAENLENATGISSRDRVRLRFAIKGTGGPVFAWMQLVRADLFATHNFVAWNANPPSEATTVTVDVFAPDGPLLDTDLAAGLIAWNARLRFLTFQAAADFTIDDVYLGVLTPA